MSKQLTDVSTFTAEITVPENSDPRTAESVEVGFQGLANRTKHLRDNAVNGDASDTYAGDLTWSGEHTFNGEIQALTMVNGVPMTIGASGGETIRLRSIKSFAIPGNATTTILAIPATWPAVNSVGYLRTELTSVVGVGAAPHYGLQVDHFTIRRLAGGVVKVRTNQVDQTTSGTAIEHDVDVADSSGAILIQVTASASSSACSCSLVARATDGPVFSLT